MDLYLTSFSSEPAELFDSISESEHFSTTASSHYLLPQNIAVAATNTECSRKMFHIPTTDSTGNFHFNLNNSFIILC